LIVADGSLVVNGFRLFIPPIFQASNMMPFAGVANVLVDIVKLVKVFQLANCSISILQRKSVDIQGLVDTGLTLAMLEG